MEDKTGLSFYLLRLTVRLIIYRFTTVLTPVAEFFIFFCTLNISFIPIHKREQKLTCSYVSKNNSYTAPSCRVFR
jgi:hypothetical protein